MADPTRKARQARFRARRRSGDRIVRVRLTDDDVRRLLLLGYITTRSPEDGALATATEQYIADKLMEVPAAVVA